MIEVTTTRIALCAGLFAFLLVLPNLSAAQEWIEQDSGTEAELSSVFFIDNLNGWVVGKNSTILHTTDAGNTWLPQVSPIDSSWFHEVVFTDANSGYIIGRRPVTSFFGGTGYLLSTKDAGLNWAVNHKMDTHYFEDMSFISPDTGWMTGALWSITEPNGLIMRTVNGGQSWATIFNTDSTRTDSINNFDSSVWFTGIEMINDSLGYVLGGWSGDGLGPTPMFKTVDGGESWTYFAEIPPVVTDIGTRGDTIWAVGWGRFAASTDGGINWRTAALELRSITGPIAFVMINGHTGFVLGLDLDGATIYYTENNWSDWSTPLINQLPWIADIYADENGNIWAVGDEGVILYTNRILAVATDGQDAIPLSYELYQNYPNPFNPRTTIQFDLPVESMVSLVVYDMLGRELRVLRDRIERAGFKSTAWDGRDKRGQQVPSGIYIARLVTPDFTKSVKMILLK